MPVTRLGVPNKSYDVYPPLAINRVRRCIKRCGGPVPLTVGKDDDNIVPTSGSGYMSTHPPPYLSSMSPAVPTIYRETFGPWFGRVLKATLAPWWSLLFTS